MIIVPTRGRPEQLMRFLKSVEDTQGLYGLKELLLIFDTDDFHNYSFVDKKNITCEIVSSTFGIQQKLNYAFLSRPNRAYYALLADDIVCRTNGWLEEIEKSLESGSEVVYGNDLIQGKNLGTHPFVQGELVRKVGWFCNTRVNHWFFDNSWMEIGAARESLEYKESLIFEHMHPLAGKAENDSTYERQVGMQHDGAHYNYWVQHELPQLIERIKQ